MVCATRPAGDSRAESVRTTRLRSRPERDCPPFAINGEGNETTDELCFARGSILTAAGGHRAQRC